MKRVLVFLSVIVLCGVFSCKQLENVQFNVNYNASLTIPPEPLTNITDSISSPEIATNVANVMKENNTNTQLIRSVTLQTLTLTITAPSGQTLGFLRNAQIYIFTDSLPAVEIADADNIPDTATSLNMDVTNAQLKPYLLANSFRIKVTGTVGTPVTVPLNVNLYLSFHFAADLLAALGTS